METKIIARVNNVDIVSTSDEQLVAIKPICEALGISDRATTSKDSRASHFIFSWDAEHPNWTRWKAVRNVQFTCQIYFSMATKYQPKQCE